jgi:hypothetical protein
MYVIATLREKPLFYIQIYVLLSCIGQQSITSNNCMERFPVHGYTVMVWSNDAKIIVRVEAEHSISHVLSDYDLELPTEIIANFARAA